MDKIECEASPASQNLKRVKFEVLFLLLWPLAQNSLFQHKSWEAIGTNETVNLEMPKRAN